MKPLLQTHKPLPVNATTAWPYAGHQPPGMRVGRSHLAVPEDMQWATCQLFAEGPIGGQSFMNVRNLRREWLLRLRQR
jgi:hypothetical protein